jgi:Pycsar effector protein
MNRTDTNLTDALTAVAGEISRTDTKASLLLALDGVLVAAVATLGSNLPAVGLALAAVGVVALVAATVLGILVVRPRLGGHDRSSFPYWATCPVEEIEAGMAKDRRSLRIKVLSGIAMAKMRALQRAADCTLIAVVALAAAALIKAV